jgi:exodeoxyribonuclease-3
MSRSASARRTYNGVALLSREPAIEVVRNIPGFEDEQARVIAGTVRGTRVIGAYFPNGQAPGSDKFAYKMRWLQALSAWVKGELAAHPELVLLGDFNIAPEDRDVHDPVAWAGQIHCTDEERAHFRALLDAGLHDAFRLFEQPPKSWSWWDYRNPRVPQEPGPAHRPHPREPGAQAARARPAPSTRPRAATNGRATTRP